MHHARCIGLIPAHAGKTTSLRTAFRLISAHPRSRGENVPASWDDPLACGSSPLTRGKLVSPSLSCRGLGLIPAHAGKTVTRWSRTMTTSAHPRSRGENASVPSSRRGMTGSSPLTRGKHDLTARKILRDRLIPAHAGKTGRQTAHQRNESAHPRSRGENHSRKERCNMGEGSSPLTRGKQGLGH